MDVTTLTWECGLVLSLLPLLVPVFWYWNDMLFFASLKLRAARCCGKEGSGKLPRGHMGLPFLGETLSFLWYFKIVRRPDNFINSKRERYGEGVGLYRSHLFGSPTIITCTPATNKFILQSTDDFQSRWPVPDLVGKASIFNQVGKQHARIRSFVSNAINKPDALQRIAQTLQPHIISTLRSWAEKGIIKASKETKKVTFENICKMFISMEPGPHLEALDMYFQGLVAGPRAYPLNFPGTTFYHALKCRRKLTAVFNEELEKRKQRKNGTSESKDLMDGLMQMKDEEGNQLRDEEVVDNIVSLVVAGYGSTSYATMWALYHISKSPEVLERLREENTAISNGKKGNFITMEDVAQLKYTAKVVEESIRMANYIPVLFRVAKRDVEYGGYRIPKCWKVLVWIRSLHTDLRNFEDPLSFNPERWNKPAKPGTFLVFGGGPRICAGNMLARLQITMILHHLVVGYKWELINPNAMVRYLPYPSPEDGAAMKFHAL